MSVDQILGLVNAEISDLGAMPFIMAFFVIAVLGALISRLFKNG